VTAPDLRRRLEGVRLVLFDVDGVLTDGRLGYGPDGDEGREFNVRDGSVIKLAQAAGLPVGILTGRQTAATARWAQDLGLAEIHQGRRDKLPVHERILSERGLFDEQVAYMGDDLLDLPVLARVGLAAAPADACPEVLELAHWRSSRRGGDGCARELLEEVLKARGLWQDLIEKEIWPGGSGRRTR
jgi:3-deoxy-D-manno-octulosonate 8-phosphate phosphatase (KDO 8-P phosphatase)